MQSGKVIALAAVLTALQLGARAGEFDDVVFPVGREEIRDVKVVQDDVFVVKFRKRKARGELRLAANKVADIEYANGPDGYRQGIVSVRRHHYAVAVGTLQSVVNRNPNMGKLHAPWLLFHLGKAYYGHRQQGDFKQGLQVLKKLVSSHPQSRFTPQAYLYIGHCYLAMKDYASAISAYDKGYSKVQSLAGRASGDRRLKRWFKKSALECLLGQGRVYDIQARARKDDKEAQERFYRKALDTYKRIFRDGDLDDGLRDQVSVAQADVLYAVGQRENAVRILEVLIQKSDSGMKIDPQTVGMAYFKLGAFYWMRAKQAEKEASKIAKKDSAPFKRLIRDSQNFYTKSMFNYLRVTVQFVQGGYEQLAGAHFFAGRCYENLKRLRSKELDLIKKARWHYLIIVNQFPRSGYVPPAKNRLDALKGT